LKGFDGYGYFWWLQGEGRFSALGIFGQQIFVNPALNLVVAVHGNDDVAEALEYEAEVQSVIKTIEAAL
jgi:CubicO group peptidase (beta-lactamase class C family)